MKLPQRREMMYKLGLVSISFRSLSVDEIIDLVKDADLEAIEWGSDVHAPCDDVENLKRVVEKQTKNGLYCSSYGTYFRLGSDDIEKLKQYILAAKVLQTRIIRIWCGTKNYQDWNEKEKAYLIKQAKLAAKMAEEADVILCMECHGGTFVNCVEGAEELMRSVNSSHFRMYWQPSSFQTTAVNAEYARRIARHVTHLHVFYWQGIDRYSLADGAQDWKQYLSCFDMDRTLLLEFMPDDRPESVKTEADALRKLISLR